MGFWFTILLIASIVLAGMFLRMKNIIKAYENICNVLFPKGHWSRTAQDSSWKSLSEEKG